MRWHEEPTLLAIFLALNAIVGVLVVPKVVRPHAKSLEQEIEATLTCAVCWLMPTNFLLCHYFLKGSRKTPTTAGPVHLYRLCVIALGSVFIHIGAVMFGAPVLDLWRKTLLLSVLLASVTFLPAAFIAGPEWQQWKRLFFELRFIANEERAAVVTFFAGLFGCYVGSFVIPLDWDRPWQAWPVSCVYGILGGLLVGAVGNAGAMVMSKAARGVKRAKA